MLSGANPSARSALNVTAARFASTSSNHCRQRRLAVLRFAPLQFHEGAQSSCLILNETFAGYGEVRHAVEPEGAEVLPEFAPTGKHPAIGQIPDRERTHAAPGPVPRCRPGSRTARSRPHSASRSRRASNTVSASSRLLQWMTASSAYLRQPLGHSSRQKAPKSRKSWPMAQ